MTSTPQPMDVRDAPSSSSSALADGVDSAPGQSKDERGSDCDARVRVESDTSANSSDEFDWDEEPQSDAQEETRQSKHARRGRALWLAFMKLARPVRTLLVGITGAALFITPLLVVELKYQNSGPGDVRSQVHAWSLWLSIIWTASCATYLIVDLLPDTIITVILLLGGQVERLKRQIELTLAVSAWLKLLLDITWAWIALSVIRTCYDPPGSYWVIINRVMQALFTAAVILFIEKLFLRFVAINFHQRALADRLAENHLGLKALDLLSNAHPTSTDRKTTQGKKGTKNVFGSLGTSLDVGGLTSAWTHRKNTNGTAPSSSDGSSTHEHEPDAHQPPEEENKKGKHRGLSRAETRRRRHKFMASIIVDQVGGAIGQVALKNSKFHKDGGLHSARKLARKLFEGLKTTDSERCHLVVEDFYPYFRSTSEAHAAFALFDKDGNGDISKHEMREAVQRIYRERKALTASLKDVSSAVAKLDAVLVCIALLFIAFACLLIFDRNDTLASLVPLATIILGFSFIFGHSAQMLFESLIFIFSTHVFDVGDLVMIDDQYLVVKEFGLFSTIFRRVDGQEIIVPNSLLSSTKLVHNMRRSTSMWESTTITISYNTSLEIVEQLKQNIQAYVTANGREWSGCGVNIDKMEYQNTISLTISIEHRSNWQDWGGRWSRRNAFMRHLKAVLEELDLKYTLPIQPVILPSGSMPLTLGHT